MVKLAFVGAENPGEDIDYPIIPVLKIRYKEFPKDKLSGALVFTSKRGIIGLKINKVELKSDKIFCIGERTRDYLMKLYGLTCKIPENEDSESLSDLIISSGVKEVNLITSNEYSRDMVKKLMENKVNVKITIIYESLKNENISFEHFEKYDSLLFGSSKSFIYTLEILGDVELKKRSLYAIGKPTRNTMVSYGFEPVETFSKPNIREIISSIIATRNHT